MNNFVNIAYFDKQFKKIREAELNKNIRKDKWFLFSLYPMCQRTGLCAIFIH